MQSAVQELRKAAKLATEHPFLPKAARDAVNGLVAIVARLVDDAAERPVMLPSELQKRVEGLEAAVVRQSRELQELREKYKEPCEGCGGSQVVG
jgi:hypothetical protein